MWCMCVCVRGQQLASYPAEQGGFAERETHLLDLIHFATKSLSVKGDMYV